MPRNHIPNEGQRKAAIRKAANKIKFAAADAQAALTLNITVEELRDRRVREGLALRNYVPPVVVRKDPYEERYRR